MTLDEAMARIEELELENEKLKRPPRPWRDAYPGSEILGWCPQTAEFGAVLSCVRKALFGEIEHKKSVGSRYRGDRRTIIARSPKRVIELTDEEYAYYSEFTKKLFTLIRETIDGWEEKI